MKKTESNYIIGRLGSVHVKSKYWDTQYSSVITGYSRIMRITNSTFKTAYKNAILNGAHIFLNEHRSTYNWINYEDKGFGFRHKVLSWKIIYFTKREMRIEQKRDYTFIRKDRKGREIAVYADKANLVYEKSDKTGKFGVPKKVYGEKRQHTIKYSKTIRNEYGEVEEEED